jgi:hypothetical protein
MKADVPIIYLFKFIRASCQVNLCVFPYKILLNLNILIIRNDKHHECLNISEVEMNIFLNLVT